MRGAQGREVGEAGIFQHNGLAVDDDAGEDANAFIIDNDLRAVAVKLHLVSPTVAFGRLLHQGRHQWLDELQPANAITQSLTHGFNSGARSIWRPSIVAGIIDKSRLSGWSES